MFELTRRRAGVILVVFAALAVALGALGSGLFDKVQGGGYSDPGSESARAATVLRDTFGEGAPNLVLLVETGSSVDDPAASAAATALARDLAAEPGIAGVASYWTDGKPAALRSADGAKGLIVASLLGTEAEVDARITDLAERFGGARDQVQVRVGGYAMLLRETVQQTEKDVVLGESIAFPVTLIALLVVFGGLVAAALPLVVAAVTVLLTVGALTLVASLTDVAATASNVATLLGLGLAIDYSLLLISRFRDELDGGAEPSAALAATMRSAGRTVAFSAVTVAIALAGLLFFPLVAVRSMGYAGLLVAALAALVSLTVLPALLLLLGHRIDRGRLRPRRRVTGAASDGFWHRLATLVMRRPLPIGLAVAALLLLLGAPFLHVNLGFPDERALPRDMASRQIAETLADEFGITEQNGLFAVLPDSADGVGGYALALSELPDVRRVDTVTGSYAGGMQFAAPGALHSGFGAEGAAYLNVVPSTGDPAALDRLVDAVRAVPAPSPVLIGGIAATNDDALAAITAALPLALGFVVLLMLVALFLLTGSVVLPVLALILSALSLTATFGALVWIFQDGHLSGLLDFTVTGDLPPTVPVMLFGVAFGLAMDYQVFLLSRIGEEYRRTGDSEAAVALGLERIGRIVTAAAVLISLVLLGFLASDITFMKAFGIGLPLAVLVDATLVRGFLLPAGMKLLGDRVWYAPGFLRKVHARFGLGEGSPEPVPAGAAPARWLIDEKPSVSAAPVVAAAGAVRTPESAAFRSSRAGKRGGAAGERNGSSARPVPSGGSAGGEAGAARGAKSRVAAASAKVESVADLDAPSSTSAVGDSETVSGDPVGVEDVAAVGALPSEAAPPGADAAVPAPAESDDTGAVQAREAATETVPAAETTVQRRTPRKAVAAEPVVTEPDSETSIEKAPVGSAPGETAAAATPVERAETAPPVKRTAARKTPAEKAAPRKTARKAAAPEAGVPLEGASPTVAGDEPTPAKRAAPRKTAARKAPAVPSAAGAEQVPAKKTAPRKTAARKTAQAEPPLEDAASGAEPTPAKKPAARRTAARKTAAPQAEPPLEGAASGTEQVPAKKSAPRKTAARKAAAPPAESPLEGAAPGAEATPAKKAAPRKTAARTAPSAGGDGSAPVKKAAPRKTAARKAPQVEGAAAPAPAKRTAARKTAAAGTAPARRATRKADGETPPVAQATEGSAEAAAATPPAEKTTARKTPAKRAPARKTATPTERTPADNPPEQNS